MPSDPRGVPAAHRRRDPRRLRHPSRGQGRHVGHAGRGRRLRACRRHADVGRHPRCPRPWCSSGRAVDGARRAARARRPGARSAAAARPGRDRIDLRQGELRSRLSATDQAGLELDGRGSRDAVGGRAYRVSRRARGARRSARARRHAGVACGRAADGAGGARRPHSLADRGVHRGGIHARHVPRVRPPGAPQRTTTDRSSLGAGRRIEATARGSIARSNGLDPGEDGLSAPTSCRLAWAIQSPCPRAGRRPRRTACRCARRRPPPAPSRCRPGDSPYTRAR